MSRARIAAWAIGACVLAACATPIVYGPIGANSGYGYRETRNSDGGYTVRVVAASPVMAHEFWDRRASELCGGPHFRKNIFRAEIPVVTVSGYAPGPNGYGGSYTEDRYGALVMEGYLYCENEPPTAEATDTTAAPEPASNEGTQN